MAVRPERLAGDAAALAVTAGSWMDYLPSIAALFSILWIVWQMADSRLGHRFFAWLCRFIPQGSV